MDSYDCRGVDGGHSRGWETEIGGATRVTQQSDSELKFFRVILLPRGASFVSIKTIDNLVEMQPEK